MREPSICALEAVAGPAPPQDALTCRIAEIFAFQGIGNEGPLASDIQTTLSSRA